ncbi:MAG: hypothetical protein ABF532_09570 [Bifidobacterium sp.]|jgi:hypothetical protein|uniref:hypothetical protein n=1 Tax=Bifidobacterium sp. TaxID=41200 RepID=UPI0039E84AE6
MSNEIDNAAGHLLRFFGKDPDIEGEKFTLSSASDALAQVEGEIALLAQLGYSRFDKYSSEIPNIWNCLYRSFVASDSVSANNFIFERVRTVNILSGPEFLLRDVRDNWLDMSLNSAAAGPELDDLLTAAQQLISSDVSISKELRAYVYLLINETRAAIELDKQGVKFVLQRAIERLLAALYSAQSQSGDPGKWNTFMHDKVKPFIAGFLGLVLPNMIAAGGLYLQLTQA